jgi:fructosamine-3-kinase
MLSPILKSAVENDLTSRLNKFIAIDNYSTVEGGSINETFRLNTNNGDYFVKLNDAKRFPNMFEGEIKGLKLLRNTKFFEIPTVILSGSFNDQAYLVMNFVDSGRIDDNFWDDFGTSLAKMHQKSNDRFGLGYDNYIGSLHQHNNQHDNWVSFYVEERLERQLKLARDDGKATESLVRNFESLYKELDSIFPTEKAALLHGDLWSGNYMIGAKGKACIFDPAVYFGHREMDIAMTKLFGGFNYSFYSAYNEIYPLEKGWKDRVEICNLYPLLVHANLFGGHYINNIEKIVNNF